MQNIINVDLSGKLLQFTNCYILKGRNLVKNDLWVRDGFILDALTLFYKEKVVADIVIDLNSNIISPGFIDIQVNGAYGYDFSSDNQDIIKSCEQVAGKLPETGVTAFCPTLITSHTDFYTKTIPKFQKYTHRKGCAKMLGVHLEGPFISKNCAGMHPIKYTSDFGPDPSKAIRNTYGDDLNMVKLVTIAPELKGSLEAILYLVSKNIIVSMGHTDADYETVKQAISAGVSFVTHIFNAMPLFHHRKDHLFGCIAMTNPNVYVGLIADLVHVSPAGMRLAESMSPDQVVLVTDCNTAFGLADGLYTFGDQDIEVIEGIPFIAGTKCLAGAVTPLLKCVQNFWLEVTHSKLDDNLQSIPSEWNGIGRALMAASSKPATVLGLYRHYAKTHEARSNNEKILKIGTLDAGSDADFIIIKIDQLSNDRKADLKLLSTWIDGSPVYNSPDHEKYITIKKC